MSQHVQTPKLIADVKWSEHICSSKTLKSQLTYPQHLFSPSHLMDSIINFPFKLPYSSKHIVVDDNYYVVFNMPSDLKIKMLLGLSVEIVQSVS